MDFLTSRPVDPWATLLTSRQRLTAKVLDALGDSPPASAPRAAVARKKSVSGALRA